MSEMIGATRGMKRAFGIMWWVYAVVGIGVALLVGLGLISVRP
jgi:hypothetical protein